MVSFYELTRGMTDRNSYTYLRCQKAPSSTGVLPTAMPSILSNKWLQKTGGQRITCDFQQVAEPCSAALV